MPQQAPNRSALVFAGLSLLAIFALTLRPSAAGGGGPSTCLLCGERGSADLILNIILFAPLGASLGRLGTRPVMAAGLGLLLALCIEFAQIVIPGRSPTWRDVILNALGMGLGAWLVRDALRLLSHRLATHLAVAAACLAGAVIASTAWLLAPEVRRSVWYAHINPRLGHLAPWSGQVAGVWVGGLPQTHGLVKNATALQDAVASQAPIVIVAVAGTESPRLAGLFAISDDEFEEMLLVGIEGPTLVVRERRRASTFRLFEPEIRLPNFFATVTPGQEIRITIQMRARSACAALDDASPVCSSRFAASSSWTLLLWRRWLGGDGRLVLGALTMLALAFPVGLFAKFGNSVWQSALAVMLVSAVWLGSVPLGLAPPTVMEWTSLVAGFVGGTLATQPLRRLSARS